MKKRNKTIVNLHDREEMTALLKRLYGNNQDEITSPQGICGTESPCAVVEVSPEAQEPLHEE